MEALTLQGMLKQHLAEVLETNRFPLYQRKALRAFSDCRTAALGGHTQLCPNGHLNGIWYNSCKHRACPQCQSLPGEKWLRNTQALLLDCPHHHAIFTMPEELNVLWRYNRELMSDHLFRAVQQTLHQFARDPHYLAAVPGMLAVLHTWGRNLSLHPHIHVLISHGGLNAAGHWVTPRKSRLFPGKPVMMVFRGKLLALIRGSLEQEKLVLPEGMAVHHVKSLLNKKGRQPWVVHFCQRYDHADGVAKYLARYVKGGAFNNTQLTAQSDTQLTFRYQSHVTKRREKLTLSHEAFIQRLVQHIPLPRKQTTRYSGLYTPSRRSSLNVARDAIGQRPVPERITLAWSVYLQEKGYQPVCPKCALPLLHGQTTKRAPLPKRAH